MPDERSAQLLRGDPGGAMAWFRCIDQWRSRRELEGLDFR